jgi:hypothetical protein
VRTVCVHILAGKVPACIAVPCFDSMNVHALFRNVEFRASLWVPICSKLVEDLKRDQEDRRSASRLLLTLDKIAIGW